MYQFSYKSGSLSTFTTKLFLLLVSISFCILFIAKAQAAPPQQAAKAGYTTLTFISFFKNDVDINNTLNSGYSWYLGRFFGYSTTDKSNITFDPTGSIVLNPKEKMNYGIATAAPTKNLKKWVGTAFGGGAYFEAELKFDSANSINPGSKGWPCFWGMAIEHMARLPERHWKGQHRNFLHFIEVDFFEYLLAKTEGLNVYVGSMHDWYGRYRKTCPNNDLCHHTLPYKELKRTTPINTNFSEYHKFGFLWIPATLKSDGLGIFFFDDKQIGSKVTWKLFKDQEPSELPQPWNFGILDSQHLVLILGTGKDQPMTVRKVAVWQNLDADNLISVLQKPENLRAKVPK